MLALLVLPAIFLLARPVTAQAPDRCDRAGCGPIRQSSGSNSRVVCFTPATPVPSTLWGELAAGGHRPPAARARHDGLQRGRPTVLQPELVLRRGHPERLHPDGPGARHRHLGRSHRSGQSGVHLGEALSAPARRGSFPTFPPGEQSKIVFGGISAPDDTVAAVAGYNGAGILVFDLTDKTKPRRGLPERRQDLRVGLHGEDRRHPLRLPGLSIRWPVRLQPGPGGRLQRLPGGCRRARPIAPAC